MRLFVTKSVLVVAEEEERQEKEGSIHNTETLCVALHFAAVLHQNFSSFILHL